MEEHMLWFVLFGCEDVKPIESDSGEPVGIVDTGIEEEETAFEPALFTMYASFGVEDDNIRSYWLNETEVLPNIQLIFYNQDQSIGCAVAAFWASESVALEEWVFEDATDSDNPVQMTQKGFYIPDVSALNIVTGEGCVDWDADRYGSLEEKMDHAWGVGFGGSLRADIAQGIQDSSNETLQSLYENDYLIAGSWSADLWEPATWASHTFTASPQEDWALNVDENGRPTTYYTSAELESTADSAIYMMNPIFLWDYNTFF